MHDLEKLIVELVEGKVMEMVRRKIPKDGNDRGMIVFGYKFRLVM